MSTYVHWQSAQSRTSELRRLDAATDSHPFARFLFLRFRPEQRPR